ncbi:CpsB/CapC family capsule biosynthesis tyrosine phosphatase [Paenibacillus sp. UMB4589-SE434]|uniref:tyrosine-protein phosphatase n=1 Tax=Paenibacillus sp. UMB4589-SE434 TaxID=3046314 RepID=UPI00254BC9B5|nr:CpsB/CapC family capsule biosynthesis tyrosine phosphatase [Paenibacillus sp. UMB4589-SE434]MDK8181998.1 hypothetical protein [Paenibacillus sp. UMB4589-SE434]
MIDIHCHVLPGMDDGPKHAADALRLGHEAARQGIRTLIATPHHSVNYRNGAEQIKAQVIRLNELFDKHGINVNVLPGQEFRLTSDYDLEYQMGHIQPLGESQYLLVEWPNDHIPDYFPLFMEWVKERQWRIVVAHPERHRIIMDNPNVAIALMEQGVMYQITSMSLLGGYGRKTMRTAYELIRQRCAHFLASDAHCLQRRSFNLREGYAAVEQHISAAYAKMMQQNAEKLIKSELVTWSI